MARHDIRGLKIQDGTYVLTSKDIYNLNDNFIQVSQEVFGTSSFARKIDKDVKKNASDIAEVLTSIGDIDEGMTEITASIESVGIKFERVGGTNLLRNSGFANGLEGWSVSNNTTVAPFVSSQYPDMPSGKALIIRMEEGKVGSVNQPITTGFSRDTKRWTISGFIRNTATTIGTTNPFATIQIRIDYTDGTRGYPAATDYTEHNYMWKKFKKVIETDDTKQVQGFLIQIIGRDMVGSLYLSSIVFEEGEVEHAWRNSENEAYSTYHTFTPEGYSIRDSNGETLLTPNGMANEQNIVIADNVEDGYPMKIPFHLGTHVSSISEVKLKWKNYPFRTYSKGAASGGGTKTTPSGGGSTSGSGGASTVSVRDWTQGLAASTSTATITSSNLGQPHYHTVSTSNLGHRHDIPSHSHTTPAHTHSVDITHSHEPVFGILEEALYSTRYAIGIYIDGVYRTTVNAAQGEVDLSSWITTSGWHEIELTSQYLKRISATVFMKTYIRR